MSYGLFLYSTRTDQNLHLYFHHKIRFDTTSQILNTTNMDNRLSACAYPMGAFYAIQIHTLVVKRIQSLFVCFSTLSYL